MFIQQNTLTLDKVNMKKEKNQGTSETWGSGRLALLHPQWGKHFQGNQTAFAIFPLSS